MERPRRPRSAEAGDRHRGRGAAAAAEDPPRVPRSSASGADLGGAALPRDPVALRRILDALPPSEEVLHFYRQKVRSFEAEERRWQSRLASSRGAARRAADLEAARDAKDAEARALRGALVEMQGAVAQERKKGARLQADNDRLRVECMDARRKVDVLLRACGQSEAELDKIIEQVDGAGGAEAAERTSVLSEQLRKHLEVTKDRSRGKKLHRSKEALKLEVASLESQLLEQERCHLEQVSTLENERHVLLREQDALMGQYEAKAGELAKYIKDLDKNQDDLSKEMEQIRSKFRRCEREWLAEKETLYRKLQLCQQLGGAATAGRMADVNAGFFTDQRSAVRLAGESRLQKKLQKVNTELANQRAATESYRSQLLAMEAEMDMLREQNSDGKTALQKRTRAMADQIETLRDQYDALDRRKKTEAQGYQADVKLLQQKIKQVEMKLVSAAVAKSKEHDYIKAIKAYDKELEKMKKVMKKSPDWIS